MSVAEQVRLDPLWGLRVYRAALYAGELGTRDSAWLAKQPGCAEVARQIALSTSAISLEIADGYSRRARRDRVRFYESALGNARMSRDCYYKARAALGENAAGARISLHTSIIRILMVLLRKDRPHPRATENDEGRRPH
jgi:four helix bundle protein